jgi:hypothetical protein
MDYVVWNSRASLIARKPVVPIPIVSPRSDEHSRSGKSVWITA